MFQPCYHVSAKKSQHPPAMLLCRLDWQIRSDAKKGSHHGHGLGVGFWRGSTRGCFQSLHQDFHIDLFWYIPRLRLFHRIFSNENCISSQKKSKCWVFKPMLPVSIICSPLWNWLILKAHFLITHQLGF